MADKTVRRESGSSLKARGGFLPLTRGGYLTTGKTGQNQANNKASRKHSEASSIEDLTEFRKPFYGGAKNGVVFENTFQMEPDTQKKFSPAKVKHVAENVLHGFLEDVEYDPKICRQISLDISSEIIRRVKSLGFDRYKIVCLTNIGQKLDQTVRMGSRCCWDPKLDSYSESVYTNRSLFAVTAVYGLYQE